MIRVKLDADIRRKRDTAHVGEALADLVAAKARVERSAVTGHTAERHRGGGATYLVDLDLDANEDARAILAAIAADIDTSAWWIDVLDSFTASAWRDARELIGFTRNEMRGWRDQLLEELADR